VAALVATVVAFVGLLGPLRAWYSRTLGRRFDLYRRFSRLGVGANKSFFAEVIGAQPAIRRTIACKLTDYSGWEGDPCQAGVEGTPIHRGPPGGSAVLRPDDH
jgi:hypothetical protein